MARNGKNHGADVGRRAFLKALATYGASMTLGEMGAIPGLGLSLLPMGAGRALAAAGTGDRKVVFLFLDGGVRDYELFNPQPAASRQLADGTTQFNDLCPAIFSGFEMEGYETIERDPAVLKVTVSPDSDVTTTVSGQPRYNPPMLQTSRDFRLGPCAGALGPFADKMTLLRGVTTSVDHGVCAQMAWTGDAFNPNFPRPTIDCLVAAKLRTDLLYPHLIWPRHYSVPLSLPQTATQTALPFMNDGDSYRRLLESFALSPLSKSATNYVGDAAVARLDAFWARRQVAGMDQVQTSANKDYYAEIDRLRKTRSMLYGSNAFAAIRDGVNSFVTTATQTMTKIEGRGTPGFTTSVLASLGLISYMFNNGLSSVATLNIGQTGWDAHGGWLTGRHPAQYRVTMFAIAEFLKTIDLTSTTVVVFSEMGRTPTINARGGTDHNAASTWALLGPLGKGKALGGTSTFLDPSLVDPATGAPGSGATAISLQPKHIHALLLEHVGYEAGRPIETLTGIRQAPDFLRALL